MKKLLALVLALAMALSLVACGGSSSSSDAKAESTGTNITIFNSKSEIQEQMEEMAEAYTEATGVGVEVYYSSDTVAAHLSTKYAANDPYTISMVDAKDVYSLATEYATDLTDEKFNDDTDYEIAIDGVVYAIPFCVEGRGVIYNADAIEAITQKPFNPEDYATTDAFKALLDELVAGGMTTPTAVQKEDWSLAAHYFCEVYEEQADVNAFIDALYDGSADLANNAKFNSLMDTFDLLKDYNYAAAAPTAAEREVSEQKLAEGEIAFLFGGNWDWSVINAYDYTENMGMMPVPQNTDDGTNAMLVGGGSKYFFIDSSENTSDEQRQAAKDFLNWLVYDEAGQKFITEDCALVPAFSNIEATTLDPLGSSIKKYADAGAMIGNFNYCPDDHISMVGASMQKYLDNQLDRAGLAAEISDYWANVTPVAHN